MKNVKVIMMIFILFGMSASLCGCKKKGIYTITHMSRKIELKLGETYEGDRIKSGFKITLSEIDVQGIRCLIAIEDLKTEEMFSGWVSKGDPVSFAKSLFGRKGLVIDDIQGDTVLLRITVAIHDY